LEKQLLLLQQGSTAALASAPAASELPFDEAVEEAVIRLCIVVAGQDGGGVDNCNSRD
jgi:hypothetical protein